MSMHTHRSAHIIMFLPFVISFRVQIPNITHVSFTFSLRSFIMTGTDCIHHMLLLMTILAKLCTVFVHSQQCSSKHTCHFSNTEGVSPLFREFQRSQSAYTSCLTYCTQDLGCIAVTHDHDMDICRFHYEADNIACLDMTPSSHKSLWIIPKCEQNGAQCCKVGLIILSFKLKTIELK